MLSFSKRLSKGKNQENKRSRRRSSLGWTQNRSIGGVSFSNKENMTKRSEKNQSKNNILEKMKRREIEKNSRMKREYRRRSRGGVLKDIENTDDVFDEILSYEKKNVNKNSNKSNEMDENQPQMDENQPQLDENNDKTSNSSPLIRLLSPFITKTFNKVKSFKKKKRIIYDDDELDDSKNNENNNIDLDPSDLDFVFNLDQNDENAGGLVFDPEIDEVLDELDLTIQQVEDYDVGINKDGVILYDPEDDIPTDDDGLEYEEDEEEDIEQFKTEEKELINSEEHIEMIEKEKEEEVVVPDNQQITQKEEVYESEYLPSDIESEFDSDATRSINESNVSTSEQIEEVIVPDNQQITQEEEVYESEYLPSDMESEFDSDATRSINDSNISTSEQIKNSTSIIEEEKEVTIEEQDEIFEENLKESSVDDKSDMDDSALDESIFEIMNDNENNDNKNDSAINLNISLDDGENNEIGTLFDGNVHETKAFDRVNSRRPERPMIRSEKRSKSEDIIWSKHEENQLIRTFPQRSYSFELCEEEYHRVRSLSRDCIMNKLSKDLSFDKVNILNNDDEVMEEKTIQENVENVILEENIEENKKQLKSKYQNSFDFSLIENDENIKLASSFWVFSYILNELNRHSIYKNYRNQIKKMLISLIEAETYLINHESNEYALRQTIQTFDDNNQVVNQDNPKKKSLRFAKYNFSSIGFPSDFEENQKDVDEKVIIVAEHLVNYSNQLNQLMELENATEIGQFIVSKLQDIANDINTFKNDLKLHFNVQKDTLSDIIGCIKCYINEFTFTLIHQNKSEIENQAGHFASAYIRYQLRFLFDPPPSAPTKSSLTDCLTQTSQLRSNIYNILSLSDHIYLPSHVIHMAIEKVYDLVYLDSENDGDYKFKVSLSNIQSLKKKYLPEECKNNIEQEYNRDFILRNQIKNFMEESTENQIEHLDNVVNSLQTLTAAAFLITLLSPEEIRECIEDVGGFEKIERVASLYSNIEYQEDYFQVLSNINSFTKMLRKKAKKISKLINGLESYLKFLLDIMDAPGFKLKIHNWSYSQQESYYTMKAEYKERSYAFPVVYIDDPQY